MLSMEIMGIFNPNGMELTGGYGNLRQKCRDALSKGNGRTSHQHL